LDDFSFADPKGFSSFTMGVKCRRDVDPPAAFYRHLEGKENAILDFEREKSVFLALGDQSIAAQCHFYGADCRIEEFYEGRTLRGDELGVPDNLRGIANELYRLHQLTPDSLPAGSFFELLHQKWGPLARRVLVDQVGSFPANEQALCRELRAIYSPETFRKVQSLLPTGPLTFCHNDTYHGNIFRLDDGRIRLLDFEFSCLGHRAYDFSNLFAETVTRHGLPDYPYFAIADPEYSTDDIGLLINSYLDNRDWEDPAAREAEFETLLQDTLRMIPLSDYVYAMAALPLAVEPIQTIRFVPYAHQRFGRFLAACG
jgi:thiamine kinase-like enzyme